MKNTAKLTQQLRAECMLMKGKYSYIRLYQPSQVIETNKLMDIKCFLLTQIYIAYLVTLGRTTEKVLRGHVWVSYTVHHNELKYVK